MGYTRIVKCFYISLVFVFSALMLIASPVSAAVSIVKYPVLGGSIGSSLVTGSDGRLWFDEYYSNKIAAITTSGNITEYLLPNPNTGPLGLASGPDGNIWFGEWNYNKIGKISTNGVVTEYSLPQANSRATSLTSGPDGNIWYVDGSTNSVGEITSSGVVTEYPIPDITGSGSSPGTITSGPDGNLWFTQLSGNKIRSVTANGVFVKTFQVSTGIQYRIWQIVTGPDGNLWYGMRGDGGGIRKINTDGATTIYGQNAFDTRYVANGPDGNIWFSAAYNSLGKITPAGDLTLYDLEANSFPGAITTGSDGNIWFMANGFIGKIPPNPQTIVAATDSTVKRKVSMLPMTTDAVYSPPVSEKSNSSYYFIAIGLLVTIAAGLLIKNKYKTN